MNEAAAVPAVFRDPHGCDYRGWSGWTQLRSGLCRGGFHVVLEDVMPANLRRAEEEYADLRVRAAAGSLELASTVEDAVRRRMLPSTLCRMSWSRSWRSSA